MGLPLTSDPAAHPVGLFGLVTGVTQALGAGLVLVIVGLAVVVFLVERRSTGEPSAISRVAARLADRRGLPIWERLPLLVVAGGLLVSLTGWRAGTAAGPLVAWATLLVSVGFAIALVGAVSAVAIAHPPARVRANPGLAARFPQITDPPAAHRVWYRPLRLGAGPIGAAVVTGGGLVALLSLPVAALWRSVEGDDLSALTPAHVTVYAAATLMVAGAWALRSEGRSVAAREGMPRRSRGLDPADALVAAAGLLVVSMLVEAGLPVAVAVLAMTAVLVLARFESSPHDRAGVAVLAVAMFVVARLAVAAITMTIGGSFLDVVPMAWQAAFTAVAVEAAGLILMTTVSARRTMRRPGRITPQPDPPHPGPAVESRV